MTLYAKIYKIIGLIVLVLGLLIIPILPKIINLDINIKENIIYIYIMFLLNSSISYFYVYKQSILRANQQNYLISKIHTYFILISNILQIGILILFKEYIPVLAIQLICRILENIIVSIRADKEFSFLKDKSIKGKLSKDKKYKLYKDTYSMLLYKISAIVINSTDNIIISYFTGIVFVGIYSNYLLIISTIKTFISYIFSSITASVGNLIVTSENKKKEFVFNQILFTSFYIYGFFSIALYILLNDFIMIWLNNKDYLLGTLEVLIIVMNFYTAGMQSAATMYRDTTGLFSVGKYRPIVAALINLGISILLAPTLGISGVLLGTIISRLSVYFWFDPVVVHKYIFNKSSKMYFIEYLKYTVVVIFSGIITNLIANLINIFPEYVSFFIKGIICIIIPNIIFIFTYSNSEYFKYLKSISISIFMKNKSKVSNS